MIDRSKTIAKSYVSEWYNQNAIKSSVGHKLISKVQNNEFQSLDAFVSYVVLKYKVDYSNYPAEFKQDATFIAGVLNKIDEPYTLLASIASTNKATYARVLEILNENVLIKLSGMQDEKFNRNKAMSRIRKLVNEKIAEEKVKSL